MKKYFLGLAAIVVAISLSAFTKQFSSKEFKLLDIPTTVNLVNDPAEWATSLAGGVTWGNCETIPEDLACTITIIEDINPTIVAQYYHASGSGYVLNTETYARAQTPKVRFFEISEEDGKLDGTDQYRKIVTDQVIPKKIVNNVAVTDTDIELGTDFTYENADLD